MPDTIDTPTTAPVAPTPGSPEHDAAMAAKFDQGTPSSSTDTPAATATRPAWLPEKFATPEDFAKSYAELEKKQGSTPPATPEATPPAAAPEAQAAAEKAVSNAGLDYTAMSTEFAANGSLSDATYASLDKAGIPRDVVDQYIAGQSAMVERIQLSAYSVAGGEEGYNAMAAWAASNLTPAEIEAYDRSVNSTNPDIVKMAVMGLKGRYAATNGSEPKLEGGNFNASTGPGFESWAQVTTEMRDPRYAKDPAFRKQVEAKLSRSNPK